MTRLFISRNVRVRKSMKNVDSGIRCRRTDAGYVVLMLTVRGDKIGRYVDVTLTPAEARQLGEHLIKEAS